LRCFTSLGGSIFDWTFSRVEVPPGHYLVRIHRWGKDLSPGTSYSDSEILAPDETYKGVIADVLPEGRHFLNPFVWSYEVQPMIDVPAGKVLVLTRLYGQPIPQDRLTSGDFLARDDGQGVVERGIVADVLRPGKHRINPYAYTWKLDDAIEVGALFHSGPGTFWTNLGDKNMTLMLPAPTGTSADAKTTPEK
jgi:hypothetical protein